MNGSAEYTKYHILIGILFDLLREKKVNAAYLAAKYAVSRRTIYRYLDELSIGGVPIVVEQGRYGGVSIPGRYKLPVGFMTEEEYKAITDALIAMKGELTDPRYENALQKITQQIKTERLDLTVTGNILVDGTAWGDVYSFSDTLTAMESAVDRRLLTQIVYISAKGETSERVIEPHLLVLKQNVWYVYAYCRLRQEFRLFRLNRIKRYSFSDSLFERRAFLKKDVPLKYTAMEQSLLIDVRLAVDEKALPELVEWLGVDSVDEQSMTAQATLPEDENLVSRLLTFGAHVKVLSPDSLKKAVQARANELLALYAE
ncbi:MAG: YafY family transcriptional regulator [Clostridia bacterium]|nr:YafY family transcriptional regulator [Clostridia bacterium]